MTKRKPYKYTKELLEPIAKQCTSIAQVLVKLNLKPAGGNHYYISELLQFFKINTNHFTGQGSNKGKPSPNKHTKQSVLENVFIENGSKISGTKLKHYLLFFKFIEKEECAMCKLPAQWNNRYLSLEVDHINGKHFDNRLKNIRLLCPNCHAQTDNYCAKNKK